MFYYCWDMYFGMEEIAIWYLFVVIGVFFSACSQILLKKSADKHHDGFIHSMFNFRVIIAYVIFFCSIFINITALSRGVNLKDIPIIESLGYVFVPLLSLFALKENITKRTLGAIAFIIMGILIFYL